MNGILNCTIDELEKTFLNNGFSKYRAKQIFVWLYRFGSRTFDKMTNISKNMRDELAKMFYIYRPKVANVAHSRDGTIKFLFQLTDLNTIETVFIPETKRNTICISTQVGCTVGCKFCNTGYNGFVRNLTTEEIISQFLAVKDYLHLWDTATERLSNIVYMGMGEPLFNYENVLKSMQNLMCDENEGISRRRITLSTSGIAPVIERLAKDLPCRLAISLHAPNDNIRSKIMPINNVYNIESILNACRTYSYYHKYLKITFEYLLLKDINDTDDCAHELIALLKNINAKVNLIQFNPWKGCSFTPSKKAQRFSAILQKAGLEAPIRARRGIDIMAACGQLQSHGREERI
ncbi:MAG: 23S rRNA (adenine(2503)-C(2))-methyltransferase RlmN [Alphaproteobacteria bacterium]|nr:23S rRNA (adenine(2503)-C(2))-methyltransferase RlmN [Alphaproteobacteria bacterium]